MPIDLSLLRPSDEGGNIPLVERWQIARGISIEEVDPDADTDTLLKMQPSSMEADQSCIDMKPKNLDGSNCYNENGSSSLHLLNKLIQIQNKRRMTQNQLNSCRYRLKLLQRQCRPNTQSNSTTNHHNDKDRESRNAITNEIKTLKVETIPKLENELEQLRFTVEDCLLPRVHNQVDDTPFSSIRLENNTNSTKSICDGFNGNDKVESKLLLENESKKNQTKPKQQQKELMDPLFCIGGYEKLCPLHKSSSTHPFQDGDNGSMTNHFSILTGVGFTLAQAISSHVLSFVNNHEKGKITQPSFENDHDFTNRYFQLANIPDANQFMVNVAMAHSIMGCRYSKNCPDTNTEQNNTSIHDKQENHNKIKLPPYALLSLLHQNKNYSETMLPLRFISITATDNTDNSTSNNIPSNYMTTVKNNKNKKNSTSKKKKKDNISPFPIYAHPINQFHLFALCASDLQSSQDIQYEFVHLILNFYESLICQSDNVRHSNNTGTNDINTEQQDQQYRPNIDPFTPSMMTKWKKCTDGKSHPPLLRSYSISPNSKSSLHHKNIPCLEPNEASRIIIEGYLPSIHEYIQLGHVSNFTDYVSRAFRIQFGGGSGIGVGTGAGFGVGSGTSYPIKGTTRCNKNIEYVHSIYGCFCHISTTMGWMLENNRVYAIQDENNRTNAPSASIAASTSTPISPNKEQNMKQNVVTTDGVVLPSSLVTSFRHLWETTCMSTVWESSVRNKFQNNTEFNNIDFVIPYIRRRFQTKNGKAITRSIPNSSRSYDNLIFEKQQMKTCILPNENMRRNDTTLTITRQKNLTIDHDVASVLLSSSNGSLSQDEINAESLTNPYDFLPFFK